MSTTDHKNSSVSPEEIADFIIAFANESGELITNLKLQKLLYYAQAWYLANKHEPLFEDDFQAWIHGPVLPRIYQKYKANQHRPIDEGLDLKSVGNSLTPEIVDFLEEMLSVYLPYSAYELEQMTHQEAPWKNARGGIAPEERSEEIIPKSSIENFYAERIKEGKGE